jgi:hypothetical protein
MREITLKECGYRLARWLLKEVPRDIKKALVQPTAGIVSQATLVDLLNTPIGLFTARARTAGQQDSKLPENAKIIDRL